MKVLSILLAVVFLASCSSTDSSYQRPRESAVVTPDPQTMYLSALRADGGPMSQGATDGELLELGYLACDAFDKGDTPMAFLDHMVTEYGSAYEIRTFLASQVAASVAFLCPWNAGLVG